MTATEFIVAIVLAIIGSNGIWVFFSKILEKKGKKHKDLIELKASIKEIKDEIDGMNDLLKKTNELAKSTARDRLNYLNHVYLDQNYIPKESVVPYKLIGESYKRNDGNTVVAEEFDMCMKELPVK